MPAGIPLDEIVVAVAQAAQRVLGSDWEGRLAAFVAALRKRLSGDFEVDEFGFDPQITEVLTAAVEPLAEKWFRLEVRGIENIPAEGGALLVANHSGTVPIDGVITGYAVKKYSGRNLRPLGADLVFALPFVGQMARKVGATLACTADAERLLTTGELAGVWPEGFKGIGKPFAERYKLQRFGRGGFVSSAMRAQVPIVPVSIVGAEEIYPLVGNVPSLARLLGHPVPADHAVLPAARPARHDPAAQQVDHRVRRADPHRRLRAGGGRRPDAAVQRHRPGARDDPADAVRPARRPRQRVLLRRADAALAR